MVTYGRGKGIVTATGMSTQIGLIAEMIQSYEEEQTPLQKKLNQLAKMLGVACLIISAIIFVYGLIRDTNIISIFDKGFLEYLSAEQKNIINLFMVAVSLAIAAVPEGLPAVVTICLALGMQRMVKRHALIRKLPAVETLGCATVICSDKTGTLTQNKMTVVQLWTGGRECKVTGEGYRPEGEFLCNDQPVAVLQDSDVSLLLHGALLCNDAKLEKINEEHGEEWRIIGDPTEGALVVAAMKGGLRREDLETILPRVNEIPFDSERKRMTTIHEIRSNDQLATHPAIASSRAVAFVKGAPDIVLELCDTVMEKGTIAPMTPEKKTAILAANQRMARQALRVLAVAFKPLNTVPDVCNAESMEKKLTFVGLVGMIDPPRLEVKDAIKIAKEAGIKTMMVTGDYRETAEAIGNAIGLLEPDGLVLTGSDLDAMSEAELADIIDNVNVCCRVSPQHKTKIVEALKARGHVVAMTGDGVNDAPALKRANIGVAMGITGTDVTKETADMVLTDDNYASIVSAVEEGRIIYSNIRKFVYFLLVCNIGEILIVFLSMLLGMPVPLRPIMLLWLNLITDGAPALALGMEKGEPDSMKQPPRPTNEPVINKSMSLGLFVVSIVDAIAILSVFGIGLSRYPQSLATAQTMAFVTLCCSELLRVYTVRSEHHSVFRIGIFSNKWMQVAVGSSLLLVLMTIYMPFLRPFFGTEILHLSDWLIMVPFMCMSPIASELVKIFLRKGETQKLQKL
jgi:Ca2+-transporting ATPase